MTSPAAPVLTTIPRVELGSVGTWDISNMTGWHPTADDFASAVAAQDCPAVRRPVLKFGHSNGPGDPALGLIDNLAVTSDGQTLVGDFVGVPAWLGSEDTQGNSVIASAYPDRSGEYEHDYVCQLGHTHPFVLHAMALLGVVRPGIGTLESLYDLYTKAPEKEPVMASTAMASTTVDQVRKAYYAGPGTNWALWIREMYVDPPELIVQNDDDDTLTRVAYTLSGDSVEFADPQTVKVEYINARAAAEKPLLYASSAESRPKKTPSAARVEVPTGEEGAMPTLIEGLRTRLGIAEDADETTALAALDEALAERAAGEAEEVEQTPELVAAAAQRLGLALVDRAQYEATVAAAAEGREARQQQLRDADAAVVAAAIGDGRIPPARREHWLASMKEDREGIAQTLASMPKGLIPLAEAGHGQSGGEADAPAAYAWPGDPATITKEA